MTASTAKRNSVNVYGCRFSVEAISVLVLISEPHPLSFLSNLTKMSKRPGTGLFEVSPSPDRNQKARTTHVDGEKRIQLKPWDRVAKQALDPKGVSSVEECSYEDLWDVCTKGHKKVHYFTELAADEGTGGPEKVGIGLSITAETMLAAIGKFKEPHNKKWIVEKHYEKAMREADELMPHLQILNCGSAGTGKAPAASFKSLEKKGV